MAPAARLALSVNGARESPALGRFVVAGMGAASETEAGKILACFG